MKKIDQLLIRSFMGPFILSLVIATFALMLQFLWLYIDELIGKGLSLSIILEFIGWGAATMISLSLPIAALLASTMAMGNLGEFNELLAMKSSGISLQRIFAPLACAGIIICIATFFATNNLIPLAYSKIYSLRDDIGNTKEEIRIPSGIFYDGIDGYILRIGQQNDNTRMLYDVMVYDHRNNTGNTNLTLADSGSVRFTPDKQSLIFTLFNGYSYDEEPPSYTEIDTLNRYRRIGFSNQELIISLQNYAFERSDDNRYSNEIMALNLKQLRSAKDSLDTTYVIIRENQIPQMLTSGLSHTKELVRPEYDTTYLQQKIPVYDSLFRWNNVTEYNAALNNGIDKLESAISLLNTYQYEERQYASPLRRIKLESLRKFTVSVACLLFFFIGAPLGAIMRKGGIGTPAIISALFFVAYWVVDISGKKLANDGAVSPLVGALVSSMFLIPAGIFLTWKAKNESPIVNVAAIKAFSDKVRKIFRPQLHNPSIIYMGTPVFAVKPLELLIEKGYNISAIVTTPDKPAGRGLKIVESEVKQFAMEKGLKLLQPHSLKDESFLEELRTLKPQLIAVVAFRMLPETVWAIPEFGTINLHASLLPQYRGAAPINHAIINGESKTGVTTFHINNQIDTGDIIFQETCDIDPEETAGDLHDKLMNLGAELLVKTIEYIIKKAGKPIFIKQLSTGIIRPAPKLTKENTQIDWTQNASSIHNFIRGLSPYPAAHTIMERNGSSISAKIFDTRIANYQLEPGAIQTDGKNFLIVGCGSGSVEIVSIQISGKKRLPVKDFIAGAKDLENCKFI